MASKKQQKVESSAELTQLEQQLESIQDQIEKINEEAAEKILEVEKKFNEKKVPLLKKRGDICSKIPDFWATVLGNFNQLTDEDLKIFKHLKDFWIDDYEDGKGFKVSLTFEKNPFFDDEVYTVETLYDEAGQPTVNSSPFKWKEGKDPTKPKKSASKGKRKEEDLNESFFVFLQSKEPECFEELKESFLAKRSAAFLRGARRRGR
eukprot:TRINITY_DN3060_c0_g1_i3.p1 TRINITY_DN3060_c0_g1~~TRINITY_DN3060_c0_g1_i3.p1  ORF type:complete len:226 (-),score=62.68 TRINITY_DN3060_c0_g1_i3:69-686(-)